MQHAVHFLSMGLYRFIHLYYTQSRQPWKIPALKGRFFCMKKELGMSFDKEQKERKLRKIFSGQKMTLS
jgi:hypothetical protein